MTYHAAGPTFQQTHDLVSRLDLPTTEHFARARSGDTTSLSWLVRRLSPWLLVQARHRLGRRLHALVDAEDLVQDVWLTAFPRLAEIGDSRERRTPALLAFLGSVLRHRVADLLRQCLREGTCSLVDEGSRAADPELFASVTGAIDHVERRERQIELERAVAGLSSAARDLLVLRGIERVPYRELAVLLGASPNALAARYRRALGELRERLRGTCVDVDLLD